MGINLNKITLEKQGDSHRIDLTKRPAGGSKEIVINLNWSKKGAAVEPKGFWASLFASPAADIDLDLGCFWELRDGLKTREATEAEKAEADKEFKKWSAKADKKKAIAALKKIGGCGKDKSALDALQFAHDTGGARDRLTKQGCYTERPWIWHTGDDRSGASADGENILVNAVGIGDLKRILVYCSIYEGVARWSETNAVVTVKVPDNPDIVVEMGRQTDEKKFCAVAMITFDDNTSMTVKKLVSFYNGHKDCDRAYEWGMKYTTGSK
jgi:tellurite resistance protein TerA